MSENIVQNISQKAIASSFDALAPLSSRALFWRAGYVADSQFLEHIPLLFWIVENARPGTVVSLGVADAVPYFAACQAIDKLNLEAVCFGIEMQGETDLDAITAHNRQNFQDFSEIVSGDRSRLESALRNVTIDLLIVNEPLTQALGDEIDQSWLPLLSENALVLFAKGGDDAFLPKYADRVAMNGGVFTANVSGGPRLALRGDEHDERLMRLTRLVPGKTGYMSVRNVFTRMGELHRTSFEISQATSNLGDTRKQRDKAIRDLKAKDDQLTEVTSHLKETAAQIAILRSEEFDSKTALEAFKSDLAEKADMGDRLQKMVTQLEAEREKGDAAIAALTEQRDALQAAHDTAEAGTNDRFGELAKMAQFLEDRDRQLQEKSLAIKATSNELKHTQLHHQTVMHLGAAREDILVALHARRISRRYRALRSELNKQVAEIESSGFFDARWYRKTYPDTAASSLSPAEHFVRSGAYEGRNPGPDFDSMKYYMANPEVAAQKMPALVHYLRHGKSEGRVVFAVPS